MINILGFFYTLVGNENEGFLKDFMGHTFAIIENGEVYKDGVHIGYLKWKKKIDGYDFTSLLPAYSKKVAKKEKKPSSGWELQFFKDYGWTKENHPKEAIQYKKWWQGEHALSERVKDEE